MHHGRNGGGLQTRRATRARGLSGRSVRCAEALANATATVGPTSPAAPMLPRACARGTHTCQPPSIRAQGKPHSQRELAVTRQATRCHPQGRGQALSESKTPAADGVTAGRRGEPQGTKSPNGKNRAPGGIRTPNLLIRSQMLYPLSYGRLETSTKCFTPARSQRTTTGAPHAPQHCPQLLAPEPHHK